MVRLHKKGLVKGMVIKRVKVTLGFFGELFEIAFAET